MGIVIVVTVLPIRMEGMPHVAHVDIDGRSGMRKQN